MKFLIAAIISVSSMPALAQSYEITAFTIDGGGGALAGGGYTLDGTIGQPDANAPLAAFPFELSGGFWTGVAGALGCSPADLAEPYGILDLSDISAFVGAFIGQDLTADLAEPFGILDLADITTYIGAFTAGCP